MASVNCFPHSWQLNFGKSACTFLWEASRLKIENITNLIWTISYTKESHPLCANFLWHISHPKCFSSECTDATCWLSTYLEWNFLPHWTQLCFFSTFPFRATDLFLTWDFKCFLRLYFEQYMRPFLHMSQKYSICAEWVISLWCFNENACK